VGIEMKKCCSAASTTEAKSKQIRPTMLNAIRNMFLAVKV
jgi:hypothetical protein